MLRALLGVLLALSACGVQGSPFLDGDRPIRILDSPWPDAATFAQSQWNPAAAGRQQVVRVALDPTSRCASEPLLAGYAYGAPSTIFWCPSFAPGSQDEARWFLAHELGHLLGGGHVPDQGNVMCGPHPCVPVWQYTTIDVAEICKLGRGGRCGR